ncbi:MAG TPA: T9SS type A sorting domain-containing protein [Bacteroidales bacterium]|nr:T9SS type A sorting domain-containing protein [Bacteroidales bacterium]
MRKSLLLVFLLIFTINLQAQKDTLTLSTNSTQKGFIRESSNININIYPVPVREGRFTIKCDKEITAVKVTNMIGQDIFKAQYKNPLYLTKINLENPKRGIYLVTINFIDGSRVVKKIMVEVIE